MKPSELIREIADEMEKKYPGDKRVEYLVSAVMAYIDLEHEKKQEHLIKSVQV